MLLIILDYKSINKEIQLKVGNIKLLNGDLLQIKWNSKQAEGENQEKSSWEKSRLEIKEIKLDS